MSLDTTRACRHMLVGPSLWPVFLFFLILLNLAGCGGGSGPSASISGTAGGSGGGGGGSGGTGSGAFTAGRTKYVRTDATTEYYQWPNSHWIMYNAITNYFFVTDPSSNHVMALDASSETVVEKIGVPGAYSIDDTPDHRTLYVATTVGDLYTINPLTLAVTNRYVGTQIGPTGFPSATALAMADGRIALLGGTGGITLDGLVKFAFWNPADNSIETSGCTSYMGNLGPISRTPDRTKIIFSSVDGGPFCVLDETTGQSNIFGPGGFPSVNFRVTPDGKFLVTPFNALTLPPNQYVYVYDMATFQLVSQFPVSGDTSSGAGFAISADSKTLFVPNDWIIYAYDLASGQQVGWIPNINVPVTSGGGAWGPIQNPNLQAVDGTGLLAGPMEEGVGFIDTSTIRTGSVGTQFTNGYANPATGPTSGTTQVQITEPVTFATLTGVYFGAAGSQNISGTNGPNTYGNYGFISAATPPSAAGPVDVYVFTADGGIQILPEGFSYSPTIVEVTPDMSTAEGEGAGVIYGYGFGPVGTGVEGPLPQSVRDSSSGIPSSLQVSIGGNPVQVTGFAPYAYPSQSPPFPLQALTYTIPSGAGAADITVTSTSGGATAHSALVYLPPIQQFALPGANLAQGIYDPHSDLYYFTDTNRIQVFSKTQGLWQSPISIPAPPGATQRLWGIALSPDGNKLAVSDVMAGVIYVLDPATGSSSVKTFPIQPIFGAVTNPSGVAISNAGMAYYAVVEQGITGARQFFKLNTTTGSIKDYGIQGPNYPEDVYLRTLISSDNSRVFFNDLGFVFYIDTAADTLVPASISIPCCYLDIGDYDMALSSDQTQFEATGYFYDLGLNADSYLAQNDREILNIAYVYGAKLSPDGRLFFQPTTNGIDVFAGKLGNLFHRISLPVQLSPAYDALVSDGKDNVLIAITGANGDGIAVVDLTSMQEPPPLPYTSTTARSGSANPHSIPGVPGHSDSHAGRPMSPAQTIPHSTKSDPQVPRMRDR